MAATHAIYPSLRGKTVLVSGGAEGIGAATVELFARQGSQVLFMDIAETSAQKTIDHIVSLSQEASARGAPSIKAPIFYRCDLTDLPELQATAARILKEHGVVHVLVNNAAAGAGSARVATDKVTAEAWDFQINVNFRHVFFLTQAVVPAMKSSGGGSIVNLGSITWKLPSSDSPIYASCKAAIMGLTRTQSKEFGEANIRVNSVMPGAIATQRQREEVLTDAYRAEIFRGQSLKRDLEPEEVAKVIVFLGSDEASAVTGSSYVVDGGWCSDP
jgi:NAD(P)-dependent dehydrogenase (short-subunit alcohol dehydrogenase family)